MTILVLADLHGKTDRLAGIAAELAAADLVLLAGDITQFGRGPETEQVLTAVSRHNSRVLAVAGNCDHPEVGSFLDKAGASLHGRHVVTGGIAFLGTGGALPSPAGTPGEIADQDIAVCLEQGATAAPEALPLVLLTHVPPFGVLDFSRIGEHAGSHAVRGFIEAHQPLACFCGHIHERVGVERLGRTVVANAGSLSRGGTYVWAHLSSEGCRAEIRSAPAAPSA